MASRSGYDPNKISEYVKVTEGFAYDKEGKIVALPWKWWESPGFEHLRASPEKEKGKRSIIRRKFIPLKPLVMKPEDFEESGPKKRNIEKGISKELFKVPEKRASFKFPPRGRQTLTTRTFNKPTQSSLRESRNTRIAESPLFNIDEAEELLKKNKLMTNPLITNTKDADSVNNVSSSVKTSPCENVVTPNRSGSVESELEFLQLEAQLASVKKNRNNDLLSSLTSVCLSLENAKLDIPQEKSTNETCITNEIIKLIQEDNEQLAIYQRDHEKRINKILELLEQSKDKENRKTSVENSNHLLKKNNVVSPAFCKKMDLRKSTLKKSLTNNSQCDSPRTKRAVEMYNSFRKDCTVLCTPVTDKTHIEFQQSSVTRSFSRRIQKQCLLLQDTP